MNDKLPLTLIQIGNSQGVRLPQRVIEEVGLNKDLELTFEPGVITIRNAKHPRSDWEAQFMADGPIVYSKAELEEADLWDAMPSPILDEPEDPAWLKRFGIDA